MTLKEMWTGCHERVYPNGMKPGQDEQLEAAFYAGVISYMTASIEVSGGGLEVFQRWVEDTEKEVEDFHSAIMEKFQATFQDSFLMNSGGVKC